MTEAVRADAVQRVVVRGNPLTVAYDLYGVFGLEQAEIGSSRTYLLRQNLGVPISLARAVAKNSRRKPDEFVRVATKLGKSIDLPAAESRAEGGIFGRERIRGRAHSNNFLHLRRHHNNIEPSKLLA